MKNNTIVRLFKAYLPVVSKHFLFYVFVFSNVLISVTSALTTVAMQFFFDSIELTISSRIVTQQVFISLSLLALAIISHHIINGFGNFYSDVFGGIMDGIMQKKIIKKIATIDSIKYEDKEYLDELEKAKNGLGSAYYVFCVFMVLLVLYLPYCIIMGFYLYQLKPFLVFALVAVFIPTVLSQIIKTGVFRKLEDNVAPIRRTLQHYEESISGIGYLKETRILGIFPFLLGKFIKTIHRYQKFSRIAQKKSRNVELICKILTLLGYGCVIAMIVWATLKQDISIGAFAAIFASIGTMFDTMNEAICIHVNNASHNIGSVKNFLDFYEENPEETTDLPFPHDRDILLKNVSFQYPQTDQLALKNITVNIEAGKTIAIVGENGSGKTTLGKILIGLYPPSQGEVFVGDVNLAEVNRSSKNRGVTAVFQNFQRYHMSLKENIFISDTGMPPDNEKITISLKKADFNAENQLTDGLETVLSPEFGGIDLSGGQWQRVAISRGYYRDHDIILLDEPTAAIDPIEESRIYEQFSVLSKGKTTIVITHRLGSIKYADKILVMKNGEIAEYGTHSELMADNGVFANMYRMQRKWYEKQDAHGSTMSGLSQ